MTTDTALTQIFFQHGRKAQVSVFFSGQFTTSGSYNITKLHQNISYKRTKCEACKAAAQDINRTACVNKSGADPELVSRGAEPMSSAPPLPSPFLPSIPPSLSFPSLLPFPFPSLSSPPFPFPPLPLKRGVRGPPPENFEILDCCRWVLAHSGMQKGVCKCVCF